MAHRKANGEGTIYRRKDGRWEGAVFVLTTNGTSKRLSLYGKTRTEVHAKLLEAKAKQQQGIPVADKTWRLGEYLDYWLEEVVRPNRRPTTYDLYESNVRLYLKPDLGHLLLKRLSITAAQAYFNQKRVQACSINKIHTLREVLGSALGQAVHEELVLRNVAWLTKLPSEQRANIHPWTLDEATRFLDAARTHQWYPAFVLLLLYGLRRGEVLGLRWQDVSFTNDELHIERQVFRAGGRLQSGPVKTAAGQRELPLLDLAHEALAAHQSRQATRRAAVGDAWRGAAEREDLVFTTPDGGMVEPQNFSRSFQRLCARHRLRRIKLHHLRHTANTLLKKLGVQARDRQLILGHSNIQTTQQVYEHDDMDWRRESLRRLEKVLTADDRSGPSEVGHHEEPGGSVVAGAAFSRQGSVRSRQISRQSPTSGSLTGQFVPGSGLQTTPTTEVVGVALEGLYLGDLTGNRTRIARMKTQNSTAPACPQHRIAEVRSLFEVRQRQWLLGIVAVNLAVKQAGDP